ncbi:MAG: VTT domain-containing protein, partial [Bryobacterales bacterium]
LASLGVWGPVAFGLLYALWAVLFLPGAALTLAGGAVFGLLTGTITVLLGATLGAALSFLIARYFARDRVERLARSNAKFAAIDRAIAKGGWKIVAMLRLSPAMPFNVQNYLYGVTAIRFWPCVLTSLVFMLPGTFLYVYLGHLAGQGLAAASGGGAEKPLGQWILLGVGLVATVAVTVYVTKLAQRALDEQAELPEQTAEPETARPAASPASALTLAALAAVLFCGALYAYSERASLQRLFGPPPVSMQEAYAAQPGGPTFDHGPFTALLSQYVDADGWVDYRGLQTRESELNAYIDSLATAPFYAMGRDEKLALLINAYNAFTLRLILDHYPIDSIRSIPGKERWDAERWTLGGRTLSLNDIEHKEIRPKFAEPRIHFALVCASVGCPPLRREAYTGVRLDEQLDDQARYVHSHGRWLRYEPGSDSIELTALYDWYGGDFKQTAGSVLGFVSRYAPEVKKALDAGTKLKVRYMDYDWSLNEKAQ